jgi:iron(III) transport system permease protein
VRTGREQQASRVERDRLKRVGSDRQSPIVAALPFVTALGCLLWAALRLRAQAPDRGVVRSLPLRPLGAWRWPALLLPAINLAAGIGLPVVVLSRWALGSAQQALPMSIAFAQQSFHKAMDQGLPDLLHSLWLSLGVAAFVVLMTLPLARAAARRRPVIDLLCALPAAVPAILLGIALVRSFHDAPLLRAYGGDFYAGWGFAVCGYAARFLPFAALTLSAQVRRQSIAAEEAGSLVPRSPVSRALRLHLPPLLPAAWSAGVLVFVLSLRELDLAVVLPAANATAVTPLGGVAWLAGWACLALAGLRRRGRTIRIRRRACAATDAACPVARRAPGPPPTPADSPRPPAAPPRA